MKNQMTKWPTTKGKHALFTTSSHLFLGRPPLFFQDQKNEEELNIMSRIQNVDYDKYNKRLYLGLNTQENTFFIIKAFEERNKRLSTYFSYCPFKVCKFGARRKTRKLSDKQS